MLNALLHSAKDWIAQKKAADDDDDDQSTAAGGTAAGAAAADGEGAAEEEPAPADAEEAPPGEWCLMVVTPSSGSATRANVKVFQLVFPTLRY